MTTAAPPAGTNTPAPAAVAVVDTKAIPKVESREVTINGKKKTLTVDQAFELAQKGEAADEKLRTSADTEARANEVLGKITNPVELEAILESMGANADEIAAALYEQRQKRKKALEDDSKLTPEQRELKELRAERAERQRLAKEEEDKKTEREQEVKSKMTRTMIANSITAVLKEVGMEANDVNIATVARALMQLNKTDEGIVQGKVNLKKLVNMMKDRAKGNLEWATQGYNADRLLDFIPEAHMEEVIKKYLERKQAKPKGKKAEELGGNSPAEAAIRKGPKFIV